MKLTYTTPNRRITAEFEADTQRELFAQISKFQEVFEEDKCGKCQGENLKFIVRTVDDNEYFEVRCSDCGAKLAFGAMKKGGGLFPKRKDGDTWLPDGGWQKWNSKTKTME